MAMIRSRGGVRLGKATSFSLLCKYSIMSNLIEQAKQKAAYAAVDQNINSTHQVIGVGSGSTVVYAVNRLQQLHQQGKLHPNLLCVPTSFQSKQLIHEAGLQAGELDDLSESSDGYLVDITVDGADEVDSELNAIKGGGAAHLREKLVANASRRLVLIADDRKDSEWLGEKWDKGIPVEVAAMGWRTIKRQIERMPAEGRFEWAAPRAELRQAVRKAGPVVTDNGNFVLDVMVGRIYEPRQVECLLKMVPGVVEVGLFCGMSGEAWFGMGDGEVLKRLPHSQIKKIK